MVEWPMNMVTQQTNKGALYQLHAEQLVLENLVNIYRNYILYILYMYVLVHRNKLEK